jgi:SAM-dependent methyltransferase
MDESKLMEFMGRLVSDMGGAAMLASVIVGDELGLYRAMADGEPVTADDLAQRTGCQPRLTLEWLNKQVAAMRGNGAIPWGDHHPCLFSGTEKFFRPGYKANLVPSWLPALDGVVAKLEAGAKVADVGCGHGASTVIMAEAYPNSRFIGYDFHEPSITAARQRALDGGVADRATFEVAAAQDYDDAGFDLVCFFDCLHDMGDPVGAARHAYDTMADDGTVLLVEPFAGDSVDDNCNPVGRMFYAASTFICTPNSLSQPVGRGLGAQAGEARLREVFTEAGFTRFRRATETPFNLIFEARK